MSSESVKLWRSTTKCRIIESFGGCCSICGYNRYSGALELHHIDPNKKDFGFGSIRASAKSWSKICNELMKCALLCSNCHKEVHHGITNLPNDYVKFNKEFLDYKRLKYFDTCPVCGSEKRKSNRTCSYKCAGKLSRKVDWDSVDLRCLLQKYSKSQIGKIFGVSDKAVHKRAKKLNLI